MMGSPNWYFLPKIEQILHTLMDQMGDHMKLSFDYFPVQKNVSFLSFGLWIFKKVHFLQFFLTSARNLSLLKQ